MVSASPETQVRLRVDREFHDVIARVRGARFRDRIVFVQIQAARFDDLRTALMEHQPQVLHISAHGEEDGALLLEGGAEGGRRVPMSNLLALLTTLRDELRLVVLNACHSERLARRIPPTIDAAIGMSETISDRAALEFAVAFYEGLAFGRTIESAFQSALAGIDEREEWLPRLFPPAEDDPGGKRRLPLLASGTAAQPVAAAARRSSWIPRLFAVGLLSVASAAITWAVCGRWPLAAAVDPGPLAPGNTAHLRIHSDGWKGPRDACEFAGDRLPTASVRGEEGLEAVLERGVFSPGSDAVIVFDLEASERVKLTGIEVLASGQAARQPGNCEFRRPEESAHLLGVVLEPSTEPRRFGARRARETPPGSIWLERGRAEEFYLFVGSEVPAIYDVHAVIVRYSYGGEELEIAEKVERRIAFL